MLTETEIAAMKERWPKCAGCGKPASCIGRYEDCEGPIEFACEAIKKGGR